MEILGRFDGRNGQITIAQERKTGARLYVEEGVKQSYVLPGGSAGLDYVRLMVRVLEGAPDIVLFGCGGGALASELHNRGCRVTVVDDNPISFEIARRYFWMPSSILCVADGMAEFLEKGSGEYAAIGVDVGGPSFDYESALAARTCALLGRRLASGGRIAVNIARDWAQDTTLVRIADRLFNEDLDAKIFEEAPRKGRSALIVATKQATAMNGIAAIASSLGFRAHATVDAASWLDVGVDLDQDDDPRHADGIHDQDAAVGVRRLESLGPFLVEHRHMIGVGQEAERLDHVRDLTPRRLDCPLEDSRAPARSGSGHRRSRTSRPS